MSDPRWLDADAASDHLSLRLDAFLRLVKSGKIPQPSRRLGERTLRWDRDALDSIMEGAAASDETRMIVDAVAEEIKAQGRARRSRQAA